MNKEIALGKEAKDKVTGFKGILVGKADYLFGCTQYAIKPKVDKQGKPVDNEWFDEGRIEIIGKGIAPAAVRVKKNGGPNTDAPKI